MQLTAALSYFLVTITCATMAAVILSQVSADMGRKEEIGCFRRFIFWYLVFDLTNAVWIWIHYGYLRISGWPASLINLLAICLVIYYWFRYLEAKINPFRAERLSFRLLSSIPLLAALGLVFSSPFTKLVFDYTPSGEYVHGPLYAALIGLAGIYLIWATVHIGYHLLRVASDEEKKQYYTAMSFWIFPLLAGVIDVIVPNLPVMELSLLVGIGMVYISMQQLQIFNDMLTGLNNRRYAQKYMEGLIMLATEDNAFYFYLVRLANLRSINREFGYAEGDRAIRFAAQILRQSADELHYQVVRWGGDDFALIVPEKAAVSPEVIISLIDRRLVKSSNAGQLPYCPKFAYGYTKCAASTETFSDITRRAAEELEKKR